MNASYICGLTWLHLTRVRLVFVSIQQCCYHHAHSGCIDYAGSVCSNSLCTCTRRNQVLARIQKDYRAKGMDVNDDKEHYFGIICLHCLVPKQLALKCQSCTVSSSTTVLPYFLAYVGSLLPLITATWIWALLMWGSRASLRLSRHSQPLGQGLRSTTSAKQEDLWGKTSISTLRKLRSDDRVLDLCSGVCRSYEHHMACGPYDGLYTVWF